MKYIDTDSLKKEIKRLKDEYTDIAIYKSEWVCANSVIADLEKLQSQIDSLQEEMPDRETILRICKLHKAWSIMAPWENVEDFVITNWNSENIV